MTSTCNRSDLQTLGSQPVVPQNLPDHWVLPYLTMSSECFQGSIPSRSAIMTTNIILYIQVPLYVLWGAEAVVNAVAYAKVARLSLDFKWIGVTPSKS